MTILTFIASTAVAVICTILAFHKDYEDGLVGRIALGMITLAAAGRMMGIIESRFDLYLAPVATLLWLGLALFFIRHLYRFLRWRKSGTLDWRRPDVAVSAGKISRSRS